MTETLSGTDTVTCGSCGKSSPVSEIILCDSGVICYPCYCTDYNVCGHCGRVLPAESLRRDGNGKPACSDCLELADAADSVSLPGSLLIREKAILLEMINKY